MDGEKKYQNKEQMSARYYAHSEVEEARKPYGEAVCCCGLSTTPVHITFYRGRLTSPAPVHGVVSTYKNANALWADSFLESSRGFGMVSREHLSL